MEQQRRARFFERNPNYQQLDLAIQNFAHPTEFPADLCSELQNFTVAAYAQFPHINPSIMGAIDEFCALVIKIAMSANRDIIWRTLVIMTNMHTAGHLTDADFYQLLKHHPDLAELGMRYQVGFQHELRQVASGRKDEYMNDTRISLSRM